MLLVFLSLVRFRYQRQETGGQYCQLVASGSGNHTTRYAETAVLPNATSESAAAVLSRNIILRCGAPRVLNRERGRSFLSGTVPTILGACNAHSPTTA